jgi:hypothetical protein
MSERTALELLYLDEKRSSLISDGLTVKALPRLPADRSEAKREVCCAATRCGLLIAAKPVCARQVALAAATWFSTGSRIADPPGSR